MPPSATLDTNLLHEYWKHRPNRVIVEQLITLARNGDLDLAVTRRVREDIPDDPLGSLLDTLDELAIIETASVTRLGYWVVGEDMLGDDLFDKVSVELDDNLQAEGRRRKLPDWRDWDHVHAHYLSGRDAFLTWDKAILKIARDLEARLGIVVQRPEDFLATLKA